MAKFDARDSVLILTPRMVGDAVWRHECGQPVEDDVRKVPDVLVYLLLKYPTVPHWLFVETVREAITEVVEADEKIFVETGARLVDKPISAGRAVQLIEKACSAGLYETLRPVGAMTNLIYRMTDDHKAKLHRIRRGEAMGYALSFAQAKDPTNLDVGRTRENTHIFRHAWSLVSRHDKEWENVMIKLKKILHVVGLSVALAMAGGFVATFAFPSVEARADFSNIIKNG